MHTNTRRPPVSVTSTQALRVLDPFRISKASTQQREARMSWGVSGSFVVAQADPEPSAARLMQLRRAS